MAWNLKVTGTVRFKVVSGRGNTGRAASKKDPEDPRRKGLSKILT
jgi:hypothetical protein